ncbi:MAG: hypothetical protein K2X55_24405 [Burkholderiaceae bacterium]|nr:hypothetical protein [Burkholderiaceae bacterium]
MKQRTIARQLHQDVACEDEDPTEDDEGIVGPQLVLQEHEGVLPLEGERGPVVIYGGCKRTSRTTKPSAPIHADLAGDFAFQLAKALTAQGSGTAAAPAAANVRSRLKAADEVRGTLQEAERLAVLPFTGTWAKVEDGMPEDRICVWASTGKSDIGHDCFFGGRSSIQQDQTRMWRYRHQYGTQLEALINWHLAQQHENPRTVAADDAPRYALGQLAWIHAVGMFQSDAARDMLALGTTGCAAQDLARAAAAHRTVIGVWKACRQNHALAIETYLAKCLEFYRSGWPHLPAEAEPTAGSNLEQAG